MKSLIKWPGGKEKEYNIFSNLIPKYVENYYEPFLGGGSVAFKLKREMNINYTFVNDLSKDLYNFYNTIQYNYEEFKDYSLKIDNLRKCLNNLNTTDIYREINLLSIEILFEKINLKIKDFMILYNVYLERRIKSLKKKSIFSEENVIIASKTSLQGALYTYLRNIYNEGMIFDFKRAAIFFFIREMCYSSMFRFSKNGDFNVPYGGHQYNKKNMEKKILGLKDFDFKKLELYNNDFLVFLEKFIYTNNDFIFLDPPYDSEFSTYDNNKFGYEDHVRLCEFLKKTKAKAMLVIKKSENIIELYSKGNFNIVNFDKKYLVNIKNRNNRDVNHLIITNYKVEVN